MGGDIAQAKQWLRRYCYEHGACVTVRETTFIYTGGEEAGVEIGLVNYPRFPSTRSALLERARELAEGLVIKLCQKTALVVADDVTEWIAVAPPGAK